MVACELLYIWGWFSPIACAQMGCPRACRFDWWIDWLIDSLIDWLIVWLIDCLFVWLSDWLIEWLSDWVTDWLTDWLMDWWIDGLMDWWIDGLMDWWIDGLMDWWIDGLMDWLIDWLIGNIIATLPKNPCNYNFVRRCAHSVWELSWVELSWVELSCACRPTGGPFRAQAERTKRHLRYILCTARLMSARWGS